jgi:hypothetical protein
MPKAVVAVMVAKKIKVSSQLVSKIKVKLKGGKCKTGLGAVGRRSAAVVAPATARS